MADRRCHLQFIQLPVTRKMMSRLKILNAHSSDVSFTSVTLRRDHVSCINVLVFLGQGRLLASRDVWRCQAKAKERQQVALLFNRRITKNWRETCQVNKSSPAKTSLLLSSGSFDSCDRHIPGVRASTAKVQILCKYIVPQGMNNVNLQNSGPAVPDSLSCVVLRDLS